MGCKYSAFFLFGNYYGCFLINYFIAAYHCKIHARIQVAEVDGIVAFLELPSKYKLPHRVEDVDSGVSCRAVDGESSLIWVREHVDFAIGGKVLTDVGRVVLKERKVGDGAVAFA